MKLALLRSARTWIIAALVASTATGVATWSLHSGTASMINNPLRELKITPDQASVEAGGTIRLTAEGDFGTMTMPVRADWFFLEPESEATGTLEGCERNKTCDFHAGDTVGVAVVQAQVGDGDAVATAKITVIESLKNPFKDELPSWAKASIVRLYHQGIIKGYDDGRYAPADSLTRGQIVTLIVRMLTKANLIQQGESCTRSPSDVPATHYAYAAVCAFGNRGWIVPKGNFRPDSVASRSDAAGYLASATLDILEKDGAAGTAQVFGDIPVSSPFFRATALLQRAGIMTGYPSGDFGVRDSLNRAAAATVIDRALSVVQNARPISFIQSSSSAALHAGPSAQSRPVPVRNAFQGSPVLPLLDSGNTSCKKSPADTSRVPLLPSAADTFDIACCEACPASDADRFYIPFAGNSCFAGDVQRNDLKGNACGNPLMENASRLPITYGTRCPNRSQTLENKTNNAQGNQPRAGGANAGGVQAGAPANASAGDIPLAPMNGSWNTDPDAPRIDCSEFERRYLEASKRNDKAQAAFRMADDPKNEDSIKARGRAMDQALNALENDIGNAKSDWERFRPAYANTGLVDAEGYPLELNKNGEKIRNKKLSPFVDRIRQLEAQFAAMMEEYYALIEAYNALARERDAAYADYTARRLEFEACKGASETQDDAIQARQDAKDDEEYRQWLAKRERQDAAADARLNRGEIPPGLWVGQECCEEYTRYFSDTCYAITLDTKVGPDITYERGNYWDQDAFDAWRQWMQAVDWMNLLSSGIGELPDKIGMIADFVAGLFGIETSPSYLSKDVVLDLLQTLVDRMPNMVMQVTIPVQIRTRTSTDIWTAQAKGMCTEVRWSHTSNITDTPRTVYMHFNCGRDGDRYSFDFGEHGCYPKTSTEWVETMEILVQHAINYAHEEETNSGPLCSGK